MLSAGRLAAKNVSMTVGMAAYDLACFFSVLSLRENISHCAGSVNHAR